MSDYTPPPYFAEGNKVYHTDYEGEKCLVAQTFGHVKNKGNAQFIAEACNSYTAMQEQSKKAE